MFSLGSFRVNGFTRGQSLNSSVSGGQVISNHSRISSSKVIFPHIYYWGILGKFRVSLGHLGVFQKIWFTWSQLVHYRLTGGHLRSSKIFNSSQIRGPTVPSWSKNFKPSSVLVKIQPFRYYEVICSLFEAIWGHFTALQTKVRHERESKW